MNRKIIRRVAAIAIVLAMAFDFVPFFNNDLRKLYAADQKYFYTVTYDSIFHDHGYEDDDGKVAYCANQNLSGPGSDGTKYYQVSSYHSYDYLMYHGYPNTNVINDIEWSNNKARDITQYAAWLIELGKSYYQNSESEAWNAAADELYRSAAAYKGGGVEDGASTLWKSDDSGKQMIIQPNPKGSVKLKKVSLNSGISEANNYYSLKGALYGVYSDEGCTRKVGELKTDEEGESNTLSMTLGKYWVKEITAPKGFEIDTHSYPVAIKAGETATVSVKDMPEYEPLLLRIEKTDQETGSVSQGTASLAGAQFTVKYYNGFYTASNLPQKAKRRWVIEKNLPTARFIILQLLGMNIKCPAMIFIVSAIKLYCRMGRCQSRKQKPQPVIVWRVPICSR